MKKILLVLFTFISIANIYSQGCSLNALVDTNSINCGDSAIITLSGVSGYAFECDFNVGVCPGWDTTSSAQINATCGGIPAPLPGPSGSSGTYLWMGNLADVPRTLTTAHLNLTFNDSICFDIVYATQGGSCSNAEGPDLSEEGVSVQYSIDTGVTWVDIAYYMPDGQVLISNPGPGYTPYTAVTTAGTSLTVWNPICLATPTAAKVDGVKIRWIQEYSSTANFDHWGLDNVYFPIQLPNYAIYYTNDTLVGETSDSTFDGTVTVSPLMDSTYSFYNTNGVDDTCFSSITIHVNPTDLGPDLLLDCNVNVVQLEALGVALNDNFYWSPTTALSDSTILNPTASPLDTTDYIFTSSCGVDTVTVNVVSNYSFSTSDDTTICVGDTAYLEVYGGAQSYTWTPNDGSISDTTISNPFFTPTNTTTYTVVTDSAGCIKTNDITIYVSNKNFIFLSAMTAGCSGGNSGSLLSVGSGAIDSAYYSIDDGTSIIYQNGFGFNNLYAGNYLVTYYDNYNCPIDTIITIPGGVLVNIDSVQTVNPLCVGATNGSIEVFIDTNVVVDYSLNGGLTQTSPIFTNLTDGVYLISVQAGSCPADTLTVVLSAPATVEINFVDSTDLTCGGSGDGEIQVNASSGVSPFNYSLDNISFVNTTGIFSSLNAGNYTIFVEDDNGCKDSLLTSISEPLPLVINNINITNVLCNGDNSGSISFDVINGTSPYTYSIDSTSFVTTNNFNNLLAGTYYLQAQDDNGCSSTIIIDSITELSALVIDSINSTIANCGLNNGSLEVLASGGAGNYQYSIDPTILQSPGLFLNIPTMQYEVTVVDLNLCYDTVLVTVGEVSELQLTIIDFDSISCIGLSNASVTVQATGGELPYMYNLNGGTPQDSAIFTNLNTGLNYFEVTDNLGNCTGNDTINIFEPTALNISTTENSVNCFGNSDGEITITAGGGTLPFVYSLNDISITQTNSTFSSLYAGNNMTYVIDANNCIDSIAQSVTQPDTFEITNSTVVNISCVSDGSITVTAQGGTTPYTYSLNSGTPQSSNMFTVSLGGNYIIEVFDANSACSSISIIDTVIAPIPVILVVDSLLDSVSCNGLSDAYISILASGGTGPYTYSFNNGTTYGSSNSIYTNAGNYILIVKDAFDCESSATNVTVYEPTVINLTSSSTSIVCNGDNNGTITINNVTGGTSPYQINIGSGDVNYTPSLLFENLSEGNYTIVVTDINNCSYTFSENVADVTSVNIVLDNFENVSCFGVSDGQISVSITGGLPIYSTELNIGSGFITANGSSVTFNDLEGTEGGNNYPIVVTDANGCQDSITQFIIQPNQLLIDSIETSPISCFGDFDASVIANVSGGSSPYTYLWTPGLQTDNSITGLSSGVQTVTVTDANNCSTSLSATILSVDPIIATINFDSAFISMGDSVQLSVNVENALSSNLQYAWSPSDGLDCVDCESPIVTVYNDIEYSVIVTDENGCINYNENGAYVIVNETLFFFIPDGFSPNGDGINDFFHVYGQDIKAVNMKVFNRWGEKIFEGTNQFKLWDGTFKGTIQNAGIYTYAIDIEFLNDVKASKKGTVTLLK